MIHLVQGAPGAGMSFGMGMLTMSEQARYLHRCVRVLRSLQKANHPHVSSQLAECQREAGFIISGRYCTYSNGWGFDDERTTDVR